MEIERFIYDDLEYIVGAEIEEYKGEKIACPYFQITYKASKRKREKKLSDKKDRLFTRISISNPIGLYKKIFKIYDKFLKDYNYVAFQAYKDSKEKRTRVYVKALEKMGFKVDYLYVCPWHKSTKEYVMCREGFELKKKEYKKIFKSMYGYWYQDEHGNWIEE